MYDYVIVTHIPVFYKVNLYNVLSEDLKIFVIFIAGDSNEKRSDDFVSTKNANFEFKILFDGDFQNRPIATNIKKIRLALKKLEYRKLIVSGWDLKEFWYLVFTVKKEKNCLALESTINESKTDSVRGAIKKIFLSRVSLVFASGIGHKKLLDKLGYSGEVKITKGVGIINKPYFETKNKEYGGRFLYVGRLSSEKNIHTLISVFNDYPTLTLTIIGSGPITNQLKKISSRNIRFLGSVANKVLKGYYLNHDVFVLPSISETWGLVVEEALHFELPVIIGKNCGASELIEDAVNGYIVDSNDKQSIQSAINKVNKNEFKLLLKGVRDVSIKDKDEHQVRVYEEAIND